jgi:hypothetical protein
MLDGVWGKQARHATESYLIMDFGESTLQEAMTFTNRQVTLFISWRSV